MNFRLLNFITFIVSVFVCASRESRTEAFQWYPRLREIRTAKEEDLSAAEENMAVESSM